MMEAVTNPPKLRKVFDYLKKQGKVKADTYEDFEVKMKGDSGKLQKVYNYLRDNDKVKAPTFEEFQVTMFPDLKKKEQTSAPTSGDIQPLQPERQVQAPRIEQGPPVSSNEFGEFGDPQALQKSLMSGINTTKDAHDLSGEVTEQERADVKYDVTKPRTAVGQTYAFMDAFNKPVVEAPGNILKGIGIGGAALERAVGLSDKNAEETGTYILGQKWLNFLKEQNIGQPEEQYSSDFSTKLGGGLGSLMSLLLVRGNPEVAGTQMAAQGAVKTLPQIAAKEAGALASKTLASRAGVVTGSFAVDEFDNAKKAGLSEDDALKVFLKNYLVNQTDAIPVEQAFMRLNTLFNGSIAKKISAVGQGGLLEGTQEGIQQYLTNQIAKGSYDPNRDELFAVLDNIKVGGVIGMLLPALGAAAQQAPPGIREQILQKAAALEDRAINIEKSKNETPNEQPSGPGIPEASTPQDVPAVAAVPDGASQADVQEEAQGQNIESPVVEPQAVQDATVQPTGAGVTEDQITQFSERVLSGEVIKSPDDLKFYNENKDAINESLNRISFKRSKTEKSKKQKTSSSDILKKDYSSELTQEEKDFIKQRGGGIYDEVIPARVIFKKPLLENWKEFEPQKGPIKERIKNGEGSVEQVAVEDIIPTDPLQKKYQIRESPDLKNLPDLYRMSDGRIVIADGHHRVSEQILSGKKSIKANVLTQSAEGTAGEVQQPQSDEEQTQGREEGRQELLTPPTAVEPAAPAVETPPQGELPAVEEIPVPPAQAPESKYIEGQDVEFEWLGETQKGKVVAPADESGKILVQNSRGTKYRVKPTIIENAPKRKAARTESLKELKGKLDDIVKKTEPPKPGSTSGQANIKINPMFYLDQVDKVLTEKIINVRKIEDYVSKITNQGLKSQNIAVRGATGMLQNILGGLAYKTSDLKNKLQFTGNKNYANLYAKGLADDLYKLIDSDPDALERVHEALDPEIAKDPKNPVTVSQLNAKEKNLYDMLRTTNDFIHNWHYSHGLIGDDVYNKHKDKYIARLYEKFELIPTDVKREFNKTRADFNMFKSRKDYENVGEEILRDPVYATAKRVSQMMQNQAIFDYADAIDNSKQITVSNDQFPGSTQLGQPGGKPYYGSLTGKWVPNYIAQDFKGFFFANKVLNDTYSAFRGYDKNIVRQMLKKSHTVWNPVVQLGNLLSNFSFAYWAGIDPFTFAKNKVKAVKEIKRNSPAYNDLIESGIIGTDVTQGDLSPVLQAGNPNAVLGKAQNKLRAALANTKVGKALDKFDELATNVYTKTDDTSKLAAYLSLRNDYGYSKEEALERVFESFQNYSTVGKMYDFAAKTPVIGNPYIKFKADLMRIIKNAVTRRPLTTMTYLAGLKLISGLLSDASDEDEDVRKARERRSFIPKLKTPAGDIPMVWQVPGVGEVNFARFLSPYYVYDKGDRNDMVNEITDWLPYQVEMAEGLSKSADNRIPIPEFGDVLLGTYAQTIFDRDFRGKSVRDPKGNEFLTQATPAEQVFNSMNYIARSQVPMFKSSQDMIDAFNGDLDYYGRERTVSQAILNNVIKVQEFGSDQAKDQLEKEVRYKVAKFYSYARDISELKGALKKELTAIQDRNVTPERKEKLIKEEVDKYLARVADRMDKQKEIVKDIEEPARLLRVIEGKFPSK
jgi:hypothetical protein